MITLFGATGYTGQLVARELDRAGLAYCIGGRSAEKLAAFSAALPSQPPTRVADVRRPHSLAALFDDAQLLINCAGPFTDLGEPVVAQAAARGVHYIDVTNELGYLYRLRLYHDLARQTGAAIVPACGLEVAIADCAVAVLSSYLPQPIELIDVTYVWGASGMSVGTRLSGLRTFATSWLAYRNGKHVTQTPGASIRRATIQGRVVSALAFPSAEIVTLPMHCDVREVRVWLAISRRAARLAPKVVPGISRLMQTPLGWLTAQVLKRIAPPPTAEARSRDRFAIQIEARSGGHARMHVATGRDPYRMTARIVAHVAQLMSTEGFSRAGFLAPSQAIDPAAFMVWLDTAIDLSVA